MLNCVFPWHKDAWQQLFSAPAALPHALLVCGLRGIGKLHFVRSAAQALLCEHPGPYLHPCGACVSCHWYHQETHPDVRVLQPESHSKDDAEAGGSADPSTSRPRQAGKQISVGQVRELSGFLDLTAHRRGRKVVVLHPAEDLNTSAANALLKTLEEPPRDTVFLLVSHLAHRVLPTVRSRCRSLPMRVPSPSESLAWLAEQGVEEPLFPLSEAGFAPLQALENSRVDHVERRKEFLGRLADETLDPVRYAATFEIEDLPRVLGWLHKWTYDLVANRLIGRTRYNPDFAASLQRISRLADVARLGRLHRTLIRYQSTLGHPLNARLVFEHLFLSYSRCVRSEGR